MSTPRQLILDKAANYNPRLPEAKARPHDHPELGRNTTGLYAEWRAHLAVRISFWRMLSDFIKKEPNVDLEGNISQARLVCASGSKDKIHQSYD